VTVVLGGAAECGNKRAVAAPAAARVDSAAAMRTPSGIRRERRGSGMGVRGTHFSHDDGGVRLLPLQSASRRGGVRQLAERLRQSFSRAKAGSSGDGSSRSTPSAHSDRWGGARENTSCAGSAARCRSRAPGFLAVEAALRADDREPGGVEHSRQLVARRCATNGSARARLPSARMNVHVTPALEQIE
jgi:hypothetical protein